MNENQRVVFVNNLQHYMNARGVDQSDIVSAVGVSASAVSDWCKGKKYPRVDAMQRLADFLGILVSDLTTENPADNAPFGKSIDGLIPRSQLRTRRVPILGDTAAGEPVVANRVYDEWVDVPDDGTHRYDAALRVTGDSMAPRYQVGDLVFVRYQDDVRDGQIAVICLDDGVTLKRVYHIRDGLQLLSENRDYPPMVFTAADGNAHLVGLAVGVLHWDE